MTNQDVKYWVGIRQVGTMNYILSRDVREVYKVKVD